MLNTLADRLVETAGTTETANFTIKANGKAFKVLIDGLYSDKIRAVIRELWTNAFDSHAVTGKLDVPFYTHLPTRYEPWFSVRDYGESMDHDTVMRLYTTVFESSKEDTNDQVGKLGLGSKSPFAYTDTFTVTAWKDGEKRMYSAFIGAKYVPQIALMSAEPSDEPQGIEVSFPVKASDEYDFKLAAQRTAIGFDVLPESNTEILPAQRTVVFEGEGWKLFKDGSYGAHARQGCVVYPIDVTAISGLPDIHRDMLRGSMLIDFPIGDLEITASREGLGYDETTIENIKARLIAIETEFQQRVAEMTASCKTYCDMLAIQEDLYSSQLPQCIRTVITRMKWRGKQVKAQFDYNPHYWTKVSPGATATGYSNYVLSRYAQPRKQAMLGHMQIVRNKTLFYFIEAGDAKQQTVLERIQAHRKTRDREANVVVLHYWTKAALTRLYVALGRPTGDVFINMKDVPKLPTNAAGNREKVEVRLVSHHHNDPADWDKKSVAANNGGLYIPLSRNTIQRNGADYGEYAFASLRQRAVRAGLLSDKMPIYAIPATLSRYYKNADNGWINFFDWVVEEAFKVVTKETYTAAQQANQANNPITDTLEHLALTLATRGMRPVNGLMAEMVDFYNDNKAPVLPNGYHGALEVINMLTTIPADWTWERIEPPHSHKELAKRYPMLGAAVRVAHSSDFNEEIREAALDYVNSIDSVV